MRAWLFFRMVLLALLAAWATGAQASWAAGQLGFLGLAKEGSWGTAVAASDYVEMMSENITTTRDRFPVKNIVAGFYEPDDYAGMFRSAGSTVQDGNPVVLGHLFRAIFNNASASVVASGALWTMNYTSPKSEFSDGVPRQPYTLEVNRDVTSSFQYAGAIASKLTMALAPNQGLRTTVEWLAKARSLIAKTTPTFVSSPVYPFTFDTASIQLGGSATARIEALTVEVDNRLEGIAALNSSNTIARVRATGPQMIRVSGTLDFTDVTEEEDFINQTERVLKLNVTRADSFAMLIDIPRFVYTAFPVGMAGPGRQTIAFNGLARYLASSLTAIGIQLTTTKSNY